MDRTTAPELPAWLSAHLTDFDRYMVDVGGRRMHVMEAGDPEGRPVLMLHGNPTWGFLYRKVVAELGDAPLRMVVPDLLGLGFSDRIAPREHAVEGHSAWLGALIDGLDLRDLVFVGQDWGGPIGTHALSTRAERVHGLVLLNTIIGPPKPGFTPTPFHRFAATPVISDLVFRLLGFPQINLNLAQGDRTSMSGEVGRAYRYPLRNLALDAAPLALARMVPDSLQHHSVAPLRQCFGFVSAFEGPAAIVWGDRDPILGRVRTFIERTLPHAGVTRTQAGHFLQEEVPAEIAAAIREVALNA